ncbi:hypothetical protein AF332_11585 [Sporosarcina globispora]|uniref:Uncharacterized protein n=1 Tax=Sporosarcina globispora TaxID=1459 RepID=A0A0M0GC22_SPOGL|nr:hypothetical protein [Sporosarcina globispora]KON87404.1 hypothetical protein AF332_11585 [Sporosarcina globispora]
MNKNDLANNLTTLLNTKLDYSGEFNTLFFIEKDQNGTVIKFLNKDHYNYILKHLRGELVDVIGGEVKVTHLNLETSPVTMKNFENAKGITVRPISPIKKEKVELPTIRNRTIKEIEKFLSDEFHVLMEKQQELRDQHEDYIEKLQYAYNYGEVGFLVKLNSYLQKIKDYEEE